MELLSHMKQQKFEYVIFTIQFILIAYNNKNINTLTLINIIV